METLKSIGAFLAMIVGGLVTLACVIKIVYTGFAEAGDPITKGEILGCLAMFIWSKWMIERRATKPD